MVDKKKSKFSSFQQFLGKSTGEAITEKDIQRGLNSADPHVVKMAKNAERFLKSKNKVAKEEYGNLNGARILSSQIHMEAFADGSVKELLLHAFPRLIDDVKEFYNSISPNAEAVSLKLNAGGFMKTLAGHAYLDLVPLTAFVPEGLVTTYIEYLDVLEDAASHVSESLVSSLNSYCLFLSLLINNKEQQLDTKTSNKIFVALEENRIRINRELGECFKNGSTKTERTIGGVLHRNSDWPEVFKGLDVCSDLINGINRRTLNKKIEEATSLLDVVMNKIKRGELDSLSPEGISDLSIGAYLIASELEFFSAVYYKVIAITTCVEKTTDHMQQILKK